MVSKKQILKKLLQRDEKSAERSYIPHKFTKIQEVFIFPSLIFQESMRSNFIPENPSFAEEEDDDSNNEGSGNLSKK